MISAPVFRLIPAAFMASAGAPVVYLLYTAGVTLSEGRAIDLSLFLTMAVTAAIFSFAITMVFVLVTVGIARILGLEKVNVFFVTVSYLTLIPIVVWIVYGLYQATILFALAIPNATLLVWISSKPNTKN